MDYGVDQVVGFRLQLIERFHRRRGANLTYQIERALQQPKPAGAAVIAEIAGDAGNGRAEYRGDQQAIEDIVAIFVEERFLLVTEIGKRSRMNEQRSVLVGRRRLDLDFGSGLRRQPL